MRRKSDAGSPKGAGSGIGEADPIERRDAVKLLGVVAVAALGVGHAEMAHAAGVASDALQQAAQKGVAFAPKFFAPDEWKLVRTLVDIVIPRDARSGSATDAGVPEFMDFIMTEYRNSQGWMRDGLAWLNGECRKRFGHGFISCTDAERRQVLDDIAYPKKAAPAMKAGVEFFNRFRDLTAGGFWSTRMGVKDLQYIGNIALAEWPGCPPAALARLGVSYGAPAGGPKRNGDE